MSSTSQTPQAPFMKAYDNKRCSNYKIDGKWTRTFTTSTSVADCAEKCQKEAKEMCNYFSTDRAGTKCLFNTRGCRLENWQGGWTAYTYQTPQTLQTPQTPQTPQNYSYSVIVIPIICVWLMLVLFCVHKKRKGRYAQAEHGNVQQEGFPQAAAQQQEGFLQAATRNPPNEPQQQEGAPASDPPLYSQQTQETQQSDCVRTANSAPVYDTLNRQQLIMESGDRAIGSIYAPEAPPPSYSEVFQLDIAKD